MSESEKPFTVNDRRHFTPDGEVREEPEAAAAAGTPKPGPPVAAEAESPAPPTAAADREEGPPRPAEPQPRESPPVDLSEFLLSLGAQAGILLSGQGLPEGADPREALAGARSMISILEMLEEKTKGNRTSHESEVLEGLLYELRLAYVEKSRAAGS